jgi:GH43 family beta-xylosidase
MGLFQSAQRCTIKWCLTLALSAVVAAWLLTPGIAHARTAAATLAVTSSPLVHNPLVNPATGKPLSCPDPSVLREPHRQYAYYMACTSDFARNALPIWGSHDGVHWRRLAFTFPKGSDPDWAVPAGSQHGRYWAPDLHYFNHRWVMYFAAELDSGTRLTLDPLPQGNFAIGVATTTNLRSGHWHSSLLHYSGQDNQLPTRTIRERKGGVIDPNEFQNPVTHQRYLVFAKQSDQIWLAKLGGTGLQLGQVQRILTPSLPWECANLRGTCTLEGPIGYWYHGIAYIMYSASSTWAGTYSVGVAASADPLVAPFAKDPLPILSSSTDLLGPGGTSEPVIAPDGSPVIYFHTLLEPDPGHISASRYLTVGRFRYGGGTVASPNSTTSGGATVGVMWPQISGGMPKNYTTLHRRAR